VIEQRDDDAVIAAIREELFRLRARHQDVGPLEAISLRGLPDDSGPEAIRSEFGRGY
jgi:hypothetical protein